MNLRRRVVAPAVITPAWRGRLVGLAVLGVAGLLTALGGWRVWRVWQDLPAPSLERIDWQRVQRAHGRLSGEALDGYITSLLSRHVTTALHEPYRTASLLDDARAGAASLRHTQLGRLQVAALLMQHLEASGVPPAEWWPRVRGYLEGLERAVFNHHQRALLRAQVTIFADEGLGPGTALDVALVNAATHGPFLQHVRGQLARLAAERRVAGDEAGARLCERIGDELLRQWVLEEGPAGLRLLAADLLARRLAGAEASAEQQALAARLQQWRAAYRRAADALPLASGPLRVLDDPTPAAWTGARLAGLLALAGVLAGAVAGAGVVALLTLPLAWRVEGGAGRRRMLLWAGPAVLVVLVGVSAVRMAPDLVRDDLVRLGELGRDGAPAGGTAWPRGPIVGLVMGLLLPLLVSGLTTGGGGRRWGGNVARTAAATWLIVAAVLAGVAVGAESVRQSYEARRALPLEEQMRQLADPATGGVLAALRAAGS